MPTPILVSGSSNGSESIAVSKLELIPNELVHEILWHSRNLNLSLASAKLARKLNDRNLRRQLVFEAFFICLFETFERSVEMSYGCKEEDYAFHGQPCQSSWISYPSGSNGVYENESIDLELQRSIMEMRWFTAEFFFSCRQEYLIRMTPEPFRQFLELSSKTKVSLEPAGQKLIMEKGPPWFQELLRSHDDFPASFVDVDPAARRHTLMQGTYESEVSENGKYRIRLQKNRNRFANSRIEHEWDIRLDTSTVKYLFSIRTLRPETQDRASLPARMFDVERWTKHQLSLICYFGERCRQLIVPTDDGIATLSNSLMKAIEQRHPLAVYLLTQSRWYRNGRSKLFGVCVKAEQQIRKESGIQYHEGWYRLYRGRDWNKTDQTILNTGHRPVTMVHLKRALTLVMEPSSAETEIYNVYRVLALAILQDRISMDETLNFQRT